MARLGFHIMQRHDRGGLLADSYQYDGPRHLRIALGLHLMTAIHAHSLRHTHLIT